MTLSIPTKASLPPTLRLDPSNAAVSKILGRLSRASLLSLGLDWLEDRNLPLSKPYLKKVKIDDHDDDEDEDDSEEDFYPPATSLANLQELYTELQSRKGSKKEILDRIVEGDWRHGLSLYQLAMADLQYLYDHPTSQTWSAYRVVPLQLPSQDADPDEIPAVDKESLVIPRFHPSSFLEALQKQALPDVKAHYNLDRHKELPLLLLRIFILDSPYNSRLALTSRGPNSSTSFDTSRTVYVAFPDASPHIYVSKPQTLGVKGAGEAKSLRSLIVDGIPKALSKPRQRFVLKSTAFVTRNLSGLLERRGAGRTNNAGGGWSIYADEKKRESPLETVLPSTSLPKEQNARAGMRAATKRSRLVSPATESYEHDAKRAKLLARARFGDSAQSDDGTGIERLDIVIEDPYPRDPAAGSDPDSAMAGAGAGSSSLQRANSGQAADSWRPKIRLTFHGSHVFAGLRQLVEHGIIDGTRMPGWMTGEEGVTSGVVRQGRIRGYRASGL